MGRSFVVGDVHGCRDELDDLLARAAFSSGDKLFFVGDLVTRGPDPIGVLDIVRRTGARAVCGNHEDKLVAWKRAMDEGAPLPKLGKSQSEAVGLLGDGDWALLFAMPLWLDLPEHGARIVHAGVLSSMPIERQPRSVLLTMRSLGENGEPLEYAAGGVLWGTRYVGPPHVVFGHNARAEVQIHPWATGLDTGAVYGRALTALVLGEGEPVPMDEAARRKALFSVPSRRRYYEQRR